MQLSNYSRHHQKGLALIELLIYFALFTVLLGLALQFLFEVQSLQLEAQSNAFLSRDARSILSELQKSIREAQSLDFPNPGETGNYLSLNSGQIIYSLNAEEILEKQEGSDTWPVHSSRTYIDSLSFERGANVDQTENVQIKINLVSRHILEGLRQPSLFLQTSVSLR